jgi:hypothetical protein
LGHDLFIPLLLQIVLQTGNDPLGYRMNNDRQNLQNNLALSASIVLQKPNTSKPNFSEPAERPRLCVTESKVAIGRLSCRLEHAIMETLVNHTESE